MNKILIGHVSPESAYVIEDYPYGYTLRCKKRVWLESHPKKGSRLMSQTTNPKRGDSWNTPKASTYQEFGGCMYINEEGHVEWTGAQPYMDLDKLKAWREIYNEGNPLKEKLNGFITLAEKYQEAKAAQEEKKNGKLK